jgi:hypothetical protein
MLMVKLVGLLCGDLIGHCQLITGLQVLGLGMHARLCATAPHPIMHRTARDVLLERAKSAALANRSTCEPADDLERFA